MSKTIKTIIVDDEQGCIDTLQLALKKYCPWIEVVAATNKAEEAIKLVHELKPQLLFIDIIMPYLNGFEVLDSITHKNVYVIFTTAHDKYAVKAFKANAIDYLLKPIMTEDVVRSAKKALSQINTEEMVTNNFTAFLSVFKTQNLYINKIALPDNDGLILVNFEDIIYLEADSNYTHVFIKDGKKITVSKSLKEFELQLGQPIFLRIHKAFIANLNHAVKYHKGAGGYLIMSNGKTIDVSRNKRQELLNLLKPVN